MNELKLQQCCVFVLGSCQVPVFVLKAAAKTAQLSANHLWMHKRKHRMPLKGDELNKVMHSAHFIFLNRVIKLTYHHY